MITLIAFIVILAVLVVVHEFGHFIVAKKSGVLVEEFGFGFPPRIWGIKIGETLYSINLLPLGGFVKVYGEEYHEDGKLNPKLKNRAFVYKKPWQKALIILAGIVCNFLLGWVLISFLFTQGVPVPTDRAIVEDVQPKSPAYIVGLRKKDEIKKLIVDGKTYEIKSSRELIDLSRQFAGRQISLEVRRDENKLSLTLTPRINPPKGQGPLGILITSFVEKKYSWHQAPYYGLIEAANITKRIVVELFKVLTQLATFQKPSADITGPIGIAKFAGQAVKLGQNATLELVALLSLNLAVINVLPFPALDGGRLVFVIYEWITKRQANKHVEKYTNLIGIIILLSLAVIISINDIVKLSK